MSLNLDPVIYGATILVSFLIALKIGSTIMAKIDHEAYGILRGPLDKARTVGVIGIMGVTGILMVLTGYKTTRPQETIGVHQLQREIRQVSFQSDEDILRESRERDMQKHIEAEEQIKREQEASKKAYEESLKGGL